MAEITIKIDCKKRICGNCVYYFFRDQDGHCAIFGNMLLDVKKGRLQRCKKCREADVDSNKISLADEIKRYHKDYKLAPDGTKIYRRDISNQEIIDHVVVEMKDTLGVQRESSDKWIPIEKNAVCVGFNVKCPACGGLGNSTYKYCSKCGAQPKGVEK